jgi:hypothetical protein
VTTAKEVARTTRNESVDGLAAEDKPAALAISQIGN